jgi:DNA-binding IclR family transcriptional regulator
MKAVKLAKKQGYAITQETYAHGLSAMSTPIIPQGKGAVGVLAMSGPAVRLTEQKMRQWAPELMAAAADIARASAASPLFDRYYAPPEAADERRRA